ncbi:AzlD family protein [Alteromonas sp. CYL-A6]|uniref:AzlD family protein n=1 Tax=Alteromonas nitratireducens TaxID=3390813 RepID=UPI0034C4BA46
MITIENDATGTLIIIAVMALVTLSTRWAGVYLMSFVPLSERVKRFIQAMSASVLVALLAPMAFNGDTATRLALATTAIVMLIFRRPLPAIAAGVVAAAMLRQW